MTKLGFTIIEIMIALLIICTLVTVTTPKFFSYISWAKTKGVGIVMLQNAQFLEKWKSISGTYLDGDRCPELPYKYYPEESQNAVYYIDSNQSSCYSNHYIIHAIPICGKALRGNGSYSCLCLNSGDSLNESANLYCLNGNGTCNCIDLEDIL